MTLDQFETFFESVKDEIEIRNGEAYLIQEDEDEYGLQIDGDDITLWSPDDEEIPLSEAHIRLVSDFCSELEEEYHQEAERPYNHFTDHEDEYRLYGVNRESFI